MKLTISPTCSRVGASQHPIPPRTPNRVCPHPGCCQVLLEGDAVWEQIWTGVLVSTVGECPLTVMVKPP